MPRLAPYQSLHVVRVVPSYRQPKVKSHAGFSGLVSSFTLPRQALRIRKHDAATREDRHSLEKE